jgi:hypothetical protein
MPTFLPFGEAKVRAAFMIPLQMRRMEGVHLDGSGRRPALPLLIPGLYNCSWHGAVKENGETF